ncbi:DUF1311 domain-containing protein [Pantoea cypripedii]|nr:DUF1311 domain-containing protein [Pantoea cypripedii]MBP2198264.1 uncharacterized protein YecT (DUF1311 family) [Pantoea cypripedii]
MNYSKYISSLSPEVKKIVSTQRQWVKFRDANCGAFTTEDTGGLLVIAVI